MGTDWVPLGYMTRCPSFPLPTSTGRPGTWLSLSTSPSTAQKSLSVSFKVLGLQSRLAQRQN